MHPGMLLLLLEESDCPDASRWQQLRIADSLLLVTCKRVLR